LNETFLQVRDRSSARLLAAIAVRTVAIAAARELAHASPHAMRARVDFVCGSASCSRSRTLPARISGRFSQPPRASRALPATIPHASRGRSAS